MPTLGQKVPVSQALKLTPKPKAGAPREIAFSLLFSLRGVEPTLKEPGWFKGFRCLGV